VTFLGRNGLLSDNGIHIWEIVSAAAASNGTSTFEDSVDWTTLIEDGYSVINGQLMSEEFRYGAARFHKIMNKFNRVLALLDILSPVVEIVPGVSEPIASAVSTATSCSSPYSSIATAARMGRVLGPVGAAAGGMGTLVNGSSVSSCISGMVETGADKVDGGWTTASDIGSYVVDKVPSVASAAWVIESYTTRGVGSAFSSAASWLGSFVGKRHLLAFTPGTQHLQLPDERKVGWTIHNLSHRRKTLQAPSASPEDQVKKSLLHMDVMLWDASALLRAETREVLTSGNIGNGTAHILVNISTIDATTKQKYQNEFAQTAAANAVRHNKILGLPLSDEAELELINQMHGLLDEHGRRVRIWASTALEAAAYYSQADTSNIEIGRVACMVQDGCDFQATTRTIANLLVHKMEARAFLLLEILTKQVRQFEYWALSPNAFQDGFPIARYRQTANTRWCDAFSDMQTRIETERLKMLERFNERPQANWVRYTIRNNTSPDFFTQLRTTARARDEMQLTGNFTYNVPVPTFAIAAPEVSKFWRLNVLDVHAYLSPLPWNLSRDVNVQIEKGAQSTFFDEEGKCHDYVHSPQTFEFRYRSQTCEKLGSTRADTIPEYEDYITYSPYGTWSVLSTLTSEQITQVDEVTLEFHLSFSYQENYLSTRYRNAPMFKNDHTCPSGAYDVCTITENEFGGDCRKQAAPLSPSSPVQVNSSLIPTPSSSKPPPSLSVGPPPATIPEDVRNSSGVCNVSMLVSYEVQISECLAKEYETGSSSCCNTTTILSDIDCFCNRDFYMMIAPWWSVERAVYLRNLAIHMCGQHVQCSVDPPPGLPLHPSPLEEAQLPPPPLLPPPLSPLGPHPPFPPTSPPPFPPARPDYPPPSIPSPLPPPAPPGFTPVMAVVSTIQFDDIDVEEMAQEGYFNAFAMLFEREMAHAAGVPIRNAKLLDYRSGSVVVCTLIVMQNDCIFEI